MCMIDRDSYEIRGGGVERVGGRDEKQLIKLSGLIWHAFYLMLTHYHSWVIKRKYLLNSYTLLSRYTFVIS